MDNHANLEMLRYVGDKLYGEHWHPAIAADLGVTVLAIRRWLSCSQACPANIGDQLLAIMDRKRKMMADVQEVVRHRQFEHRLAARR